MPKIPKLDEKQQTRVHALAKQGYSRQVIADRMGVSRDAIRRILDGVNLTNKKEPQS